MKTTTPTDVRYRDIHSSDPAELADARRQRNQLQRAHRVARRAGEEPEPTPPLFRMIAPQDTITPTSTPPVRLQTTPPVRLQTGSARTLTPLQSNGPTPASAGVSPTPLAVEPRFAEPDPSSDLHGPDFLTGGGPDFLTQPAVSDKDWGYIQRFQGAMYAKCMETCERCLERWFDMNCTVDGVCRKCRTSDGASAEGSTFLYSAENELQPAPVPNLPELTEIEEQLIARIHVAIQVRQVRGQQYKYSGHVVNFLRNTAHVYEALPLLPRDLDIVVLRPSNYGENERLHRQFRADCRVRRNAVRIWLDYLIAHHPAYRDIKIHEENLSQLPADGNVLDELLTCSTGEADIRQGQGNERHSDEEEVPVTAAVPDVMPSDTELEQLRQEVQGSRFHLTMPSFRTTPIAEFNTSQPVMSWAFPTLYPDGKADFLNPRIRTVTFAQYAKHLMRYHDGRFARHPRWRYVVFNTLMRQQANRRAGFYVRNSDKKEISLDELQEAFEQDTTESAALLQSISRFSGTLRGTRPFWAMRRIQLLAYVQNLGPPQLFLTLSAADLHWDDLMRHMPRYEEWRNGTPEVRNRIARMNLKENPHIAAYWFHVRFSLFKREVLSQKWKIEDNWCRYEWQGRGSSHTHGLYWISNAPDSEVQRMSPAQRSAFAAKWGILIKAVNPEPMREAAPFNEVSPLSLQPELQTNTMQGLSAIINRVQRHKCGTAYCQRVNRRTGATYCRFRFPMPLLERPELRKGEGEGYYRLYAKRNDPDMNNYSRLVSMAWLANTDISPCTGEHAVVHYMSKYVSKGEEQTATYQQMMRQLLPHANTRKPLLSAVSKLMNQLIGEHDWSAQEVCHLLLDIPLQEGSRTVIGVDVRPEEQQRQMYSFVGVERAQVDGIAAGKSWLQKYCQRPDELADVTYIDFLRRFDIQNRRYKKRHTDQVLNLYPVYKDQKSEDFARVKLMLNHAFRNVDELFTVEGVRHATFHEAYEFCQEAHIHPPDPYGREMPEEPEASQQPPIENEDIVEPWMELAGQLPHNNGTEVEDANNLGNRQIDREYNWARHIGQYTALADDY